ncbi:MAG: AMP-binding protein [Chloroflexi bacterium]|nr:AMP-binding protein [Chloroflexota bacterium]MDA1227252.1 AMP-binding protein [Chloroflexota bacterium]
MPIPNPARPSLAPYELYPLQDLLSRTSKRLPDKVAIIDGDRTFTFQQLQSYSDKLAAALTGIGVSPGDRVGLLAPNCAEFEIAFFGIVKAGAIASTINSGYREREIAHQLNNSGAELLIVHEAMLEMAESAKSDIPALKRMIVIKEGSIEPTSFWGIIEGSTSEPPAINVDALNDLVALPYSSGTTGFPKGVMLTHQNLTSNVEQLINRPGEAAVCTENDVVLVHLPLFHIYGMNVIMNPCIALGATQVMMGRFDMEYLLRLLSEHKVTVFYSVPPVGLGLSQYPGVAKYDLSSIRYGLFGAAPLSSDLQDRIQAALGFPIIQGYGLTETSPVTNVDFIEANRRKPGSIGPATSDTEQKVVDVEDFTREVPFGESGELLIRGPQVMQGYYNDPDASADTLTPDEWLRTGDIVRMDEDGYVWVLDRKKELIKYKGFQVPPAELEGLLLEHPAVADAAVIGKADEESGEIPKAFVVRKAGQQVSAEDIMEFVAGKVSTFKHVREVEFVEAIPKNPSGKILRRILVEQERAKSG